METIVGIIVGIIVAVLIAILVMMVITMLYHFFSVIVPIIAIVMFAGGVLLGIWHAIKNTFIVYKEVYRKK